MNHLEAIRVVLVDDQPLVREGIATILNAHDGITVVGQAVDGAEAIDVVTATAPDVVCMDVEMPGMDGIEATRRITSAHPPAHSADDARGPKILVLTTFNREDYVLAALEAGASGFLLKTARPEQLADAIRAIAAGDALLSPEVTRTIIQRAVTETPATPSGAAEPAPSEASPRSPSAPSSATHPDLTERETEVLQLVALGLSNDEIAARLFIGRATVKTHVSTVLMKLQLRDRVPAVAYAYRHGLVTTEDPTD